MNATMRYWINQSGALQPGTDDPEFEPDPSWILAETLPEYGDQIYDFASGDWGPSYSAAVVVENAWRDGEVAGIDDQIAMIEDADPAAVGTIPAWRAYRKALRLWVEDGPGFPFGARPTRPQ